MKLLTIVSFPHDNLVNTCWPTIFKNIFMTYSKSVSMSLFYLDWTWNLRRSRISRNLLESWNKYRKKHEFCFQKSLKNHLIYFKDLNVSLNIVWECILCVMGFQMTYRTCSYESYSLLCMYINHTLKSCWWRSYVRVCLKTKERGPNGFMRVSWTGKTARVWKLWFCFRI